ncbi:S9 family peptidase, partial [bacterium]|nr:S9 family peptidase [bacterium]
MCVCFSKKYWCKLAFACAVSCLSLPAAAEPQTSWEPMECPRSSHTDTYHGVSVSDPYRWLEDIDSEPAQAWVEAQVKQTDAFLQKLPGREAIRRRLDELQNYEKFSAPKERGGRIFFAYNSGLQNQSVICVVDDPVRSPNTVRQLLDPNTMSKDGTVAISGWAVSDDGRYLAYGTAEAGSDWNVWHVKDVESGRDLKDELRWVKFSRAVWDGSSSGFYYSRYPAPKKGSDLKSVNHNHTLYYHRVGTPQSQDEKVLALPEHPDWNISADVSEDGRWLYALSEDPVTDFVTMWVKRLDAPAASFELMPQAATAHFYPIDIDGDTMIARSDFEAPNFRLLTCDLSKPAAERCWKELVPEQAMPLSEACRAGSYLLLNYYKDAHNKIMRYSLDGRFLSEIALPGMGSAS